MSEKKNSQDGELIVRTLAMPSDTNPDGDIFGGWLLSQMDIAGGIFSKKLVKGRTVTVAVESMNFHKPVFVGDVLCCYAKLIKIGKTSIRVKVEAWTIRAYQDERIKVTEGEFIYVAIDENRAPKQVGK
ncbi:acyl-CoA thioesterase [Bacteriovoracaceae bacterium]|nr:acyl-CoA thioesterase [Bacteriovoracaceae bacterium]|tara:strand:+ start:98275 stop:98661 length:387 start_codon:yes stop_codon:yes gene_type:complete